MISVYIDEKYVGDVENPTEFIKKVKNEIMDFLNRIQIQPKYFIPISAKQGDNLCRKSKKMAWYNGLSLIEVLTEYSPDA